MKSNRDNSAWNTLGASGRLGKFSLDRPQNPVIKSDMKFKLNDGATSASFKPITLHSQSISNGPNSNCAWNVPGASTRLGKFSLDTYQIPTIKSDLISMRLQPPSHLNTFISGRSHSGRSPQTLHVNTTQYSLPPVSTTLTSEPKKLHSFNLDPNQDYSSSMMIKSEPRKLHSLNLESINTVSSAKPLRSNLQGQLHGLGDLAVHAVGEAVQGLGAYLGPKLVVTEATVNAYKRIKNSTENGNKTSSAVICGLLGSAVETSTSLAGNTAVIGTASYMVGQSGGAGLAAAVPFAAAGFDAVSRGSQAAGDLSEKACHRVADKISEINPSTIKRVLGTIFLPAEASAGVEEERVRQVTKFHMSPYSDVTDGDLIGMVIYDHNEQREFEANGEKIVEGYIYFRKPGSIEQGDGTMHRKLFNSLFKDKEMLDRDKTTVSGFTRRKGEWKQHSCTLNARVGENYTKQISCEMSDYEFNRVKEAVTEYLQEREQAIQASEANRLR